MIDLCLHIGGQSFLGWTSATITESLDTCAHVFTLSYVDRWIDSAARRRIREGDPCELWCADEVFLTGWVDSTELDETASSQRLTVGGRSRTGDLVDCSVIGGTSEWRDVTLQTLADDILEPFGMFAAFEKDARDTEPFAHFAVEPGETAFELLSRAAKQRRLILQTTSSGGLVFSRGKKGRTQTVIKRGVNATSFRVSRSLADRFSEVRVRAQAEGEGSAWSSALISEAAATDRSVGRYRPKVVMADAAEEQARLSERANFEVASRYARGTRVSVTLPGWRTDEGTVWRAGLLAWVESDWHEIEEELIVASVQLSLSNEGEIAQLELCDRAAFDLEPLSKTEDSVL